MSEQLRKGDKVMWQSHGSTVTGTVEEKIASTDEPQYRVRSAKSGKDAVHKPDALRRSN